MDELDALEDAATAATDEAEAAQQEADRLRERAEVAWCEFYEAQRRCEECDDT